MDWNGHFGVTTVFVPTAQKQNLDCLRSNLGYFLVSMNPCQIASFLHDISFVTDISTTFYRKGFGGTQNLHPLIGLQEALPMMLQGKEVRSIKAKKIGLVDMIVASQSLEQVAIDSALALADGTLKKNKVSITMTIALSSICTSNTR